MATQFYARYVPPADGARGQAKAPSRSEGIVGAQPRKKPKLNASDPNNQASPQLESKVDTLLLAACTNSGNEAVVNGHLIPKLEDVNDVMLETGGIRKPRATSERKSKKEKREKTGNASEKTQVVRPKSNADIDAESIHDDAHRKVREKFARSKVLGVELAERQKRREDAADPHEEAFLQKVEAEGLVPLPQPAEVPDSPTKSTVQALPEWLAKPTLVKADATLPFRDLGLGKQQIEMLSKLGIEDAFAIQAAVLQMLLPGPKMHHGDICISAATGSGKTLAYTLPIVKALKDKPVRKLRAVIVVPTRELVDQVKDTFQQCNAGLEIGVAVGSKSLKQEQATIIRKVWRFDRQAYKVEQKRLSQADPWDWLDEPMDDDSDDNDDDDPLAELPNMVAAYKSNVDVLICTPGRLVDHVRTTNGFTLEHLQWLIIDEADKLLDQGFQQWLEVVIPLLETEPTTSNNPRTMSASYDWPRQRHVRKVILSATMARDVSKLEQLNLHRPALVALEGENSRRDDVRGGKEEEAQDTSSVLPAQLIEVAIPVREAADKPLYLLQLIEESMPGHRDTPHKNLKSPSSSITSANSSSSDSSQSSAIEGDSDSPDVEDSGTSSDDASITSESPERRIAAPLRTEAQHGILVFTNINENALRLCRLIALLRPSFANLISPFTKSSGTSSGRRTLAAFRKRKLSVIVASDRASRGLDLKNLAQVVNYDMPTSLTSYVHRIGRTARAGAAGVATTLVAHHEARWFWNEIGRSSKIERARKVTRREMQVGGVSDEDRESYELALKQLGKEARGDEQ
ncbi:MAG: hypothetical protein LQ340_005328 [Diploschistes diacapsis]|nr:MAG: hypothetical protein LQ340_005328 [Diploschistes diacapsis]